MQYKNIEVEIRALLTKEEYQKLRDRLDHECEFLGEEHQVSYYFDAPVDLRAQESDTYSKIWMKGGKMHEAERKEVEIMLKQGDIAKAKELFALLGFPVSIVWERKRRSYKSDDLTICLDDTIGYGRIIEFELMSTKEEKAEARTRIHARMERYGIEPTPKETFDRLFAAYKENWRTYFPQSTSV